MTNNTLCLTKIFNMTTKTKTYSICCIFINFTRINSSNIISPKNILFYILISENIKICKKILRLDSKDMKTVKRLCVLYLANRDNKLAEDLILERKIKLDELNMKDFSSTQT